MGIEGLAERLHLFRILFGKIVLFTQILLEVIQLGKTIRFYLIADEFPLSLSDSIFFVVECFMGGFRFRSPQKDFADVMPVDDPILRNLLAAKVCYGGQEIDGGHDLGGDGSCGNLSGPPGKGGDPHVPFVFGSELMPPQGATGGLAGSSVVIGEKNKGVLLDPIFSYAFKDSTRT